MFDANDIPPASNSNTGPRSKPALPLCSILRNPHSPTSHVLDAIPSNRSPLSTALGHRLTPRPQSNSAYNPLDNIMGPRSSYKHPPNINVEQSPPPKMTIDSTPPSSTDTPANPAAFLLGDQITPTPVGLNPVAVPLGNQITLMPVGPNPMAFPLGDRITPTPCSINAALLNSSQPASIQENCFNPRPPNLPPRLSANFPGK